MDLGNQEPFETFTRTGQPLGIRTRAEVHRQGHWHRSAQLFLFTPSGELLVHQRAADKDLYPNLWDHSVGEHLQPGEDFAAAAHRGAQEELGLQGLTLQPLGKVRAQEFKDPAGAWWDRELQQSFRAMYHPAKHGAVQMDAAEVIQADYWDQASLANWIGHRRAELTPWFESDLVWHKLLVAQAD